MHTNLGVILANSPTHRGGGYTFHFEISIRISSCINSVDKFAHSWYLNNTVLMSNLWTHFLCLFIGCLVSHNMFLVFFVSILCSFDIDSYRDFLYLLRDHNSASSLILWRLECSRTSSKAGTENNSSCLAWPLLFWVPENSWLKLREHGELNTRGKRH